MLHGFRHPSHKQYRLGPVSLQLQALKPSVHTGVRMDLDTLIRYDINFRKFFICCFSRQQNKIFNVVKGSITLADKSKYRCVRYN